MNNLMMAIKNLDRQTKCLKRVVRLLDIGEYMVAPIDMRFHHFSSMGAQKCLDVNCDAVIGEQFNAICEVWATCYQTEAEYTVRADSPFTAVLSVVYADTRITINVSSINA